MIKYRLYIDESGNSDLNSSDNPNHRYLAVTGVAMSLEYVAKKVSPELEKLKNSFFGSHPDEPVILHRKEMIFRKHPFDILTNPFTKEEFNKVLLELLNEWEYIVFSVVIDKKELKERYHSWQFDPYHYCLTILIERYVLFLEETDALGDVMAESRGSKEDNRLKDSFHRLVLRGTDYIGQARFLKNLTSIQLKVKPKSNNIAGLQIADILAHPSRREILIENKAIDKGDEVFGDKIINILQRKYYQKDGKINGYGKKYLP